MFKQVLLGLSLATLVLCQVTPEDVANMGSRLKELEQELRVLRTRINKEIKQAADIVMNEIREKGDEKALECCEAAVPDFIQTVDVIARTTFMSWAKFCQNIREKLESGKFTMQELETLKSDTLDNNGRYIILVNEAIERAKKLEVGVIFEFTEKSRICLI